ncbi:Fur family transcriptional regulator [Streptococcus cameli]
MHSELFQEVLDYFKQKGVRLTETRKAVIAYLIDSSDHPSAEMIYHNLLPLHPSLSLATVYNNLRLLLEAGFITELKRKNDPTTYYDFMGHDHLNIICEKCGDILDIDIERESLIEMAEKQTGFHIHRETLTMYGTCPQCLSKS